MTTYTFISEIIIYDVISPLLIFNNSIKNFDNTILFL